MRVEKRDGRIQRYDFSKIENVIYKVFNCKSVNKPVPDGFIDQLQVNFDKIIDKIEKKDKDYAMPIEEIQDTIRDFLIKKNQTDAAEAFILYRNKRNIKRERESWLTKEIAKRLKGEGIQNQNANVDEASFGGKIGEISRAVMSDYAIKNLVSKTTRDNFYNNEVYPHDKDSYAVGMHNCLSEPLDKMLNNGVNTRQTDVRKANSINTACQLIAVYFQLQSLQQFGGVSGTHIDWTLVPFFRKSLEKHYLYSYIKGLDSFYDLDILNIDDSEIDIYVRNEVEKFFVDNENISDESFTIDNRKLFEDELFQQALFDTRKELYQAVEGLIHNLNTLQSRSGNQLPFSSINYGTCTLPEGRMVIKALLETSLKGTGKHGSTSIFPCGIFQYMKGINDRPGTTNYDLKRLALKSCANRIYPNFANCDWSNQLSWVNTDRKIKKEYIESLSDNEYYRLYCILKDNPDIAEKLDIILTEDGEYDMSYVQRPTEIFSTMGCRTANGYDVNFLEVYERNIQHLLKFGTLEQDTFLSGAQKDGRGNICPATIIMPTLAMNAKLKNPDNCYSEFMKILETKIDECKDSLIDRFRWIANQHECSAKFMYENATMEGYVTEQGIVSALKHGTLAIGQIGLAETLTILFGFDHTTPKGMEYAKEIESLFRDKCNEFKKEYSLNFGVYYTPAESLCYTAFKKWKDKFGDYEGVTYFIDENGERQEKLYFTNSMHVPVYYKISAFEKIDIESQLTGYSSAGCITYIEDTHEISYNIDAVESQLDYAMEHDIPYFAVNRKIDFCKDCGHRGYITDTCPKCGSHNIKHLARVTGYITGHYPDAFNKGKIRETEQRQKHIKEIKL